MSKLMGRAHISTRWFSVMTIMQCIIVGIALGVDHLAEMHKIYTTEQCLDIPVGAEIDLSFSAKNLRGRVSLGEIDLALENLLEGDFLGLITDVLDVGNLFDLLGELIPVVNVEKTKSPQDWRAKFMHELPGDSGEYAVYFSSDAFSEFFSEGNGVSAAATAILTSGASVGSEFQEMVSILRAEMLALGRFFSTFKPDTEDLGGAVLCALQCLVDRGQSCVCSGAVASMETFVVTREFSSQVSSDSAKVLSTHYAYAVALKVPDPVSIDWAGLGDWDANIPNDYGRIDLFNKILDSAGWSDRIDDLGLPSDVINALQQGVTGFDPTWNLFDEYLRPHLFSTWGVGDLDSMDTVDMVVQELTGFHLRDFGLNGDGSLGGFALSLGTDCWYEAMKEGTDGFGGTNHPVLDQVLPACQQVAKRAAEYVLGRIHGLNRSSVKVSVHFYPASGEVALEIAIILKHCESLQSMLSRWIPDDVERFFKDLGDKASDWFEARREAVEAGALEIRDGAIEFMDHVGKEVDRTVDHWEGMLDNWEEEIEEAGSDFWDWVTGGLGLAGCDDSANGPFWRFKCQVPVNRVPMIASQTAFRDLYRSLFDREPDRGETESFLHNLNHSWRVRTTNWVLNSGSEVQSFDLLLDRLFSSDCKRESDPLWRNLAMDWDYCPLDHIHTIASHFRPPPSDIPATMQFGADLLSASVGIQTGSWTMKRVREHFCSRRYPDVSCEDPGPFLQVDCPPDSTTEVGQTNPSKTGYATLPNVYQTGKAPVKFIDTKTPDGPRGEYVITRVWQAADARLGAESCTQTITVTPATTGYIIVPNATLSLVDSCNVNSAPRARGYDSQGYEVPVVPSDPEFYGDITVRTWSMDPSSGVSAPTRQQEIPSIPRFTTCPPQATVFCKESVDPDHTGHARARGVWDAICPYLPVVYEDSEITIDEQAAILRHWSVPPTVYGIERYHGYDEPACDQIILLEGCLPEGYESVVVWQAALFSG